MKKCPKCSKEFTDDIVYCTACNTPLEKVEQTTNTDTKNTQSEPPILNRLKHRNKTHKQQTHHLYNKFLKGIIIQIKNTLSQL